MKKENQGLVRKTRFSVFRLAKASRKQVESNPKASIKHAFVLAISQNRIYVVLSRNFTISEILHFR